MGLAGGGQHADRKGRDKESRVQGSQPPADAESTVSRGHPVNRFGGRWAPVGLAGGQPGLEPRVEADRQQGWTGLRGCDGQRSYMQPNCEEKEFTDIEDVVNSACLRFVLSKLLANASHPVTGEPGGRGSQRFQRDGMAYGGPHANSSLGTMGRILCGPWSQAWYLTESLEPASQESAHTGSESSFGTQAPTKPAPALCARGTLQHPSDSALCPAAPAGGAPYACTCAAATRPGPAPQGPGPAPRPSRLSVRPRGFFPRSAAPSTRARAREPGAGSGAEASVPGARTPTGRCTAAAAAAAAIFPHSGCSGCE
ncbi:hypothetical protein R6Z07F_006280 [Ovis aries]